MSYEDDKSYVLFQVHMCSIITLPFLGSETFVKDTVKPGSLPQLSMNGKTEMAVATVPTSIAAFRRKLLLEIPT